MSEVIATFVGFILGALTGFGGALMSLGKSRALMVMHEFARHDPQIEVECIRCRQRVTVTDALIAASEQPKKRRRRKPRLR